MTTAHQHGPFINGNTPHHLGQGAVGSYAYGQYAGQYAYDFPAGQGGSTMAASAYARPYQQSSHNMAGQFSTAVPRSLPQAAQPASNAYTELSYGGGFPMYAHGTTSQHFHAQQSNAIYQQPGIGGYETLAQQNASLGIPSASTYASGSSPELAYADSAFDQRSDHLGATQQTPHPFGGISNGPLSDAM